jgi:hypothetical protein
MTIKTYSSVIGTRRVSGEYQASPIQLGVTAHVTVSFDDTVVKSRDQLMAACKAIADAMLPIA